MAKQKIIIDIKNNEVYKIEGLPDNIEIEVRNFDKLDHYSDIVTTPWGKYKTQIFTKSKDRH